MLLRTHRNNVLLLSLHSTKMRVWEVTMCYIHHTLLYMLPLSPVLLVSLLFWKWNVVQFSLSDSVRYELKCLRIRIVPDCEITCKVYIVGSSVSGSEKSALQMQNVSICFCLPNGRGTAEACANCVIRFVKDWLRFGGFSLNTEVTLNLSLLGLSA
jgi:hypothetical protein